ncbi:MAG: HNH endonuclease [Armatimonadetes bacterium]|nr:HNH endonuclease [Armatimonadota bacterium]
MSLSRGEFESRVFARDRGACVNCKLAAVDAHHIIDRKLFEDGGYHLDNGVALCADCHKLAERSQLSCQHLRQAAGITRVILPPGLDPDLTYDKWGNPVEEPWYLTCFSETGVKDPGEMLALMAEFVRTAGIENECIEFVAQFVATHPERVYNPHYGDERLCDCGHPYYRHFDTYDSMSAIGCKYCACQDFQAAT